VTIKWLLQLLVDCCNSKINSKDFHTQVSLLATLFFGRNVFFLFFSEFFPVTVTENYNTKYNYPKNCVFGQYGTQKLLIFLKLYDTYILHIDENMCGKEALQELFSISRFH
jgi:hypothetical protein